MPEDLLPLVYIVSDAVGETAEVVVKAAASQFNAGLVEIKRVPHLTRLEDIKAVVKDASQKKAIIAYTLVLKNLKEELEKEARENDVPVVDILGPMIEAISKRTEIQPKMEPGLLRRLNQDYFQRVEAVEFAVKYDDGRDPRGFLLADLVLIGISRTSKTPLSMYLAHKGIKVANLPLVPEIPPPSELFRVPSGRVIGLIAKPEILVEIRTERLKTLGLKPDADYAKLERILEELDYAQAIMKKIGCTVIDVTGKAVEETAALILEIYQRRQKYGE